MDSAVWARVPVTLNILQCCGHCQSIDDPLDSTCGVLGVSALPDSRISIEKCIIDNTPTGHPSIFKECEKFVSVITSLTVSNAKTAFFEVDNGVRWGRLPIETQRAGIDVSPVTGFVHRQMVVAEAYDGRTELIECTIQLAGGWFFVNGQEIRL